MTEIGASKSDAPMRDAPRNDEVETTAESRLADALAACAGGDRHGVSRILSIEGGRLFGVARRMLGRGELAEEAVQDAMVQVWTKAEQYKADHGSARGWIYAILRNRCLNILRSEKRMSACAPDDMAALQDARQHTDDPYEWRMLPGSSRLRQCLDQIEPATRTGILLAHVSGYSHGEIAAIMKVPLGTTKSWIRRGLSRLRECLS
ncbi:sigma-70 family RNA polymerase sigma factor [Aurantimonas coralicida]|uniref:sigma-70 family RNA polymerase sigma factor n=1 Tax=Aurantimonas coralicida TaxID=182270 RepID=UPI0039B6F181